MSGTYGYETRVLGEVKSVEAPHARSGLLSRTIAPRQRPISERKTRCLGASKYVF